MAEGIKISQLSATALIAGGFIEISIPDGVGGWLSKKYSLSDIIQNTLDKPTYDPGNVAQDVFNSLFQQYDPSVSGLSSTDIQNAIDELTSLIDGLATGEANTGVNLGGEYEVFKDKSGVNLQLRTIKAGSNISISYEGDTILLNALLGGFDNVTKWLGDWVPGQYDPYEMVQDDGWLMIANAQTTDRPAPIEGDDPAWLIPDVPTWTPLTQVGVSYSGMQFELLELSVISGYRVWLPEVGVNIAHNVFIFNLTNPSDPQLLFSDDLSSIAQTGWHEIPFTAAYLPSGTVLRVVLETVKSTGNATFDHDWTYTSATTTPSSGDYSRNAGQSLLYINEFDDLAVDRSGDLDTLKSGDHLRLEESGNNNRYDEYSITAIQKVAGVYQIDVIRTINGQAIRDGQLVNISAIVYAGVTASPYVEIANFWDGYTDKAIINGFVTNDYSSIPLDDDARGVDVFITYLEISDAWDFMAYSGGISLSGTGSASNPNFVLFDDITARDLYAENIRSDGMVGVVRSDGADKYTEYQLQNGITNSDWVRISPPSDETISRTIYIDPTGSDTTGGGTIGLPYATPLKAYKEVRTNVLAGVTVTIHANAGSYSWDSHAIEAEFCRITTYEDAEVLLESDMVLADSGFTLAAQSPKAYIYDVTGTTFTANEHQDKFLLVGSNYWPIAHNGTDTINALPGAGAAVSIYEPAADFTLTEKSFAITAEYNGSGTDKISLKHVKISIADFMLMEFTRQVEITECQFYGEAFQFINDFPWTLRRNMFVSSGTSYGLQMRLPFGSNLNQSVVRNTGGAGDGLISSNGAVNAINGLYIYNFAGGVSMNVGSLTNVGGTSDVVIDTVDTAFKLDNGTSFILSRNGKSLYIEDVNYMVGQRNANRAQLGNYKLLLSSLVGTPNTDYLTTALKEIGYVNPKQGVTLLIPGIYPEYDKESFTVFNNNNDVIDLGDITQNTEIIIGYYIDRNGKLESGRWIVQCTASAIAEYPQDAYYDDANETGLTITFGLSTNTVQGTFTLDDNVDDGNIQLIIQRKMT